jgi:hypothetical protein
MRVSSIFLLLVGCAWALFDVLMFLAIAGITDGPVSLGAVVAYWGGMLVGPLSLIVGSYLVLMGGARRSGTILIVIGCLALTGFTLYNTIAATHVQPLQAPPPYSLYLVLLFIMVLVDIAGFRIVRQFLSPRISK